MSAQLIATTKENAMNKNIFFPDINTMIYASIVKPGMVIRMPDGKKIEVERITEGYSTWTFDNGCGRKATCDYGDRVELLGYFNPEKN